MSVTAGQAVSLLENVLFETPDQAAANAAAWVAQSAANAYEGTIAGLATAMAASPESTIASTIVGFYRAALGRAPSGAEIAYYVAIAEQGMSAAQIAAGTVPAATLSIIAGDFTHSPEFVTDVGSNSIAWMYENILGQTPNPVQLAYYQQKLDSGTSVTDLFQQFTASPSFVGIVTSQIDAGLASYGAAIASGGTPPTTLPPITVGQTPPPPPPPPSTVSAPADIFTTGTDNLSTTDGSLTYSATLGGSSPTLTTNDSLHGNGNTLTIDDNSGSTAQDVLPSGLALTAVPTIILITTGNAGIDHADPFDLSGFADVTSLTVNSSGTQGDFIKVGGGVAVTITSASATIDMVSGFLSLAITDNALATLDLTGTSGGVTLTDTSGPTSLTINAASLTLSGGITDSSGHIASLTIAGTGTSSIDSISGGGLTSLTVTGNVALGSSSSDFLVLPSSLTSVTLSSDSADIFVKIGSASTSVTTGNSYSTIDLASHAATVHLGPNGHYGTDPSTPNAVIDNATTGVSVLFTGFSSIALYALENLSATSPDDLITQLETVANGNPRTVIAEHYNGDTYIVATATGVVGSTDTTIVELTGNHGININASGQIVLIN